MKRTMLIATMLGISLVGTWLALSAGVETEKDTETAVFKVTGMTCGGCEVALKMAVKKLDGIHNVEASHTQGEAAVVFDPSQVTTKEIEKAIEKLGYTAEFQQEEGKG